MTDLDQLPTTNSGHIKKADAVRWLNDLKEASSENLKQSVIPKPSDFSGSTYPTEISTVRITGAPNFIESAGSLLKPLIELENEQNRVEIKLQQIEDRESGELTDNYALYLSIAERG